MLPPLMSNRVHTSKEMCQRIPDIPDSLCNVYELFCNHGGAREVFRKLVPRFCKVGKNEF